MHINIEPLRSGDPDFLELLDQLRSELPQGTILSMAACPPPTVWYPFWDVHWDRLYFPEAARRADQTEWEMDQREWELLKRVFARPPALHGPNCWQARRAGQARAGDSVRPRGSRFLLVQVRSRFLRTDTKHGLGQARLAISPRLVR